MSGEGGRAVDVPPVPRGSLSFAPHMPNGTSRPHRVSHLAPMPTASRPDRRTRPSASCLAAALVAAVLVVGASSPVRAQQLDSARAGIARPVGAGTVPPAVEASIAAPDTLQPPISPRRAFFASLLVPGAGQAKLDRGYAGAMFFFIEMSAIALAHRSAEDLRIARRFSRDSVPLRYQLDAVTGQPVRDANGDPTVAEWRASRYDAAYVRTRKLHYEDWLAVLAFNHLFAGADAFVAAQLWDLPGKVAIKQTPFGPLVLATIPFR